MTRMDQDYAPVLEGVDRIIGEMAKNVLSEAGIPSLLHGPDFDMAELGAYAHSTVRGLTVFVPRSAEARAKEVLGDTFGDPAKQADLDDAPSEM